jgi:tetratricopeptide (TPR) repeat protein
MILRATVAVAAALTLTACSWFDPPDPYIVPEKDTPREQLLIARDQEKIARQTFSRKNREEEYRKAIAAYRAVIDRFPKDEEATPFAFLRIGDLETELDRTPQALAAFTTAADKYAKDESVRVLALWGIANAHEKAGSKAEAQKTYRAILEEFGRSSDKTTQAIVAQARLRYNRVR